jgi:molybdopterin converting factor small subunit
VFFELTGKATSNFNNNQTNVEEQLKALRRASQTLNYDENNSTLLADFEGVLKEYVCSRVAEGRLVQEVEDMVQQAGEKMERQLEKIRVVCGEMRRKLSEVAGGCEGVDLGFSVVKSMDDMRSSGGIVVQEVAKPMAKGEMCVEDCAIDETQCTIINSNMAKSKKEVCK